jgi:hypothetical protein
MRRHLLGAIALTCLLVGAALQLVGDSSSRVEWASACLRIGAVLGAVWLALPQLRKPGSRWLIGAFLTAFIVLAVRPRLFWFAALLAIVAYVLRPRPPRTPARNARRNPQQPVG